MACSLEISTHFGAVAGADAGVIIPDEAIVVVACVFDGLLRHLALPFPAHLLDLLLVIQGGVVGLAGAADPFPPAQVFRVDGDAVVFGAAAGADERPAAFLFFEI